MPSSLRKRDLQPSGYVTRRLVFGLKRTCGRCVEVITSADRQSVEMRLQADITAITKERALLQQSASTLQTINSENEKTKSEAKAKFEERINALQEEW